jgi:hypothetical protein
MDARRQVPEAGVPVQLTFSHKQAQYFEGRAPQQHDLHCSLGVAQRRCLVRARHTP